MFNNKDNFAINIAARFSATNCRVNETFQINL